MRTSGRPVTAAEWPCFAEYGISDGRIHPVVDESSRYDVWAGYVPEARCPSVVLDLAHAYETLPASGFGSYAVGWASQNGLLGTGLARLLHARHVQADGEGIAATRMSGSIRKIAIYDANPPAGDVVFPFLRSRGTPIVKDVVIALEELAYPMVREYSLQEYWAEYLDPDTDPLPVVGSGAFWRHYGEDISVMGQTAQRLAAAAAAFSNMGRMPILEMMADDAALVLDTKERGHVRWQSTSLIGAHASMTLQDLDGGYGYHACDCGRVFAARRYKNKPMRRYCSETCKSRLKQRRYRAAHKRESE